MVHILIPTDVEGRETELHVTTANHPIIGSAIEIEGVMKSEGRTTKAGNIVLRLNSVTLNTLASLQKCTGPL